MTKFQVGPAKTRDGKDAIVHALDGPSDMPMIVSTLHGARWCIGTRFMSGQAYGPDYEAEDVMPNVDPRAEARRIVREWCKACPQPGFHGSREVMAAIELLAQEPDA